MDLTAGTALESRELDPGKTARLVVAVPVVVLGIFPAAFALGCVIGCDMR